MISKVRLLSNCEILAEALDQRVEIDPHGICAIFLQDGENVYSQITYKELQSKAKKIAAKIQQVAAIGERAILLYQPGIEIISTIFACAYSGVIAILTPIPNPDSNMFQKQYKVFEAILNNSAPKVIVTEDSLYDSIRILLQTNSAKTYRWIFSNKCLEDNLELEDMRTITSESLVTILYTSGSTSEPKGVMISNKNIISMGNVWADVTNNYLSQGGPILMWMPIFHISGLMAIYETIFTGHPLIFMETNTMLQKPLRWLKAIQKYQAKLTGGPNFAYELCCNTISDEEASGLDLSCLELAFNAAEYVRPETMEKFHKKFASAGFKMSAFYPSYGLTETTSTVSLKRESVKDQPLVVVCDAEALINNKFIEVRDESNIKTRVLVGQGIPIESLKVKIVEPDTLKECKQDSIGEIWLQGDSISHGYWLNEEDTTNAFKGHISQKENSNWLRTGDLGCIYKKHIFIVGRLKDLIIINGKNYHPVDIESSIDKSHPLLSNGCSVVFSIDDNNSEGIVAIVEINLDLLNKNGQTQSLENILKSIQEKIAITHGVAIKDIIFVKSGAILRTANGKVKRSACRKLYQDGNVKALNIP